MEIVVHYERTPSSGPVGGATAGYRRTAGLRRSARASSCAGILALALTLGSIGRGTGAVAMGQ